MRSTRKKHLAQPQLLVQSLSFQKKKTISLSKGLNVKSTFLKILSRIIRPTEGVIRGKGKVSSLLEVGTGFHYELTGRENIFISGYMLGMKKKEILEMLLSAAQKRKKIKMNWIPY